MSRAAYLGWIEYWQNLTAVQSDLQRQVEELQSRLTVLDRRVKQRESQLTPRVTVFNPQSVDFTGNIKRAQFDETKLK